MLTLCRDANLEALMTIDLALGEVQADARALIAVVVPVPVVVAVAVVIAVPVVVATLIDDDDLAGRGSGHHGRCGCRAAAGCPDGRVMLLCPDVGRVHAKRPNELLL